MLITLIGCGKMGSAMLQGWLNDPELDADFAIVEPHHDALAWTASHTNVSLFADCAAAAAAADRPSQMVVLAVKPQMMDEAIVSLAGIADSDTAFLSIAAGIPTASHIGLTPHTVANFGGFKIQGRTAEAAMAILEDALAIQDAGCFMLEFEAVPAAIAKLISAELEIPTIGIGAGYGALGGGLVGAIGIWTHACAGGVAAFDP